MATLKNGLSRRSFLTLGSVTALGGAAALAGCARKRQAARTPTRRARPTTQLPRCRPPIRRRNAIIAIVGAGGGAGMSRGRSRARRQERISSSRRAVTWAWPTARWRAACSWWKPEAAAGKPAPSFRRWRKPSTHIIWSTRTGPRTLGRQGSRRHLRRDGRPVHRRLRRLPAPRPDKLAQGCVRARQLGAPPEGLERLQGEDRMKPSKSLVESRGRSSVQHGGQAPHHGRRRMHGVR